MKTPKQSRKPSAPKNKSLEIAEADTLLNFLFTSLNHLSKTTVKSLLAHRQITVNGRPTTQFDTPLKPGDKVFIGFDKTGRPFYHPQLDIVYEDDFLIVINKAAGLLSMATERIREKTAYHLLSDYLKQKDPHNRIFILHRLDRETSGLMMFAKNPEIQKKLQDHWDETILERKYVAVVEGRPDRKSGTIRSYIAENTAFVVHKTNAEEGKLAITHYRLLKSNPQFSLLELELETGRKNQIRVHMQEIGTPVTGDKKYGARYNPLGRLALHAFKLRFIHPETQKEMNFETPLPKRFLLQVKNRQQSPDAAGK